MAHWDQRDPRWLVKELGSTGSNVNGWHWEEKSKLSWCKQRLHELTDGIEVEVDPAIGCAKLSGLQELTGEAYLARRKGNKLLAMYDLCITLSWQGKLSSEDKEIEGTMMISEFALGSDEDDYELLVTSGKTDEKYNSLIAAVKGFQPTIFRILALFEAELKAMEQ